MCLYLAVCEQSIVLSVRRLVVVPGVFLSWGVSVLIHIYRIVLSWQRFYLAVNVIIGPLYVV